MEAELAKAKRAVKTYGQVIDKQCRDVLDITGLHHLINENGDGHWDVVWMRLFEMRDELAGMKARAKESHPPHDARQGEPVAPDEAVEAAADAINRYAAKYVGGGTVPLKDMSLLDREYALGEARAALEAAAPFILRGDRE